MHVGAEPAVCVGLIEGLPRIEFELEGAYLLEGRRLSAGRYSVSVRNGGLVFRNSSGTVAAEGKRLHFVPAASDAGSFTLLQVAIGRHFHWERFQDQQFHGELICETFDSETITVINSLPLERYLEAVICSEMNPRSPLHFLKAHCVISRGWLLAQIQRKRLQLTSGAFVNGSWTDAGIHEHFDVCADDHCQRYHGFGRVNAAALDALTGTRGEVLTCGGEICDTRFSKCCGGITERFSTAWDDRDISYLQPVPDCAEESDHHLDPVAGEEDAVRFIRSRPRVYCNVTDRELLSCILPDFDRETRDFFRWEVSCSQEELGGILMEKTGHDFGGIRHIGPRARGPSGRIWKLHIAGEKMERTFGKELEIRRILSPTHLYSSAFVVEPYGTKSAVPAGFRFMGAGWGHGVGLCQIGAAAMASQGYDYKTILTHYFKGAVLKRLY